MAFPVDYAGKNELKKLNELAILYKEFKFIRLRIRYFRRNFIFKWTYIFVSIHILHHYIDSMSLKMYSKAYFLLKKCDFFMGKFANRATFLEVLDL